MSDSKSLTSAEESDADISSEDSEMVVIPFDQSESDDREQQSASDSGSSVSSSLTSTSWSSEQSQHGGYYPKVQVINTKQQSDTTDKDKLDLSYTTGSDVSGNESDNEAETEVDSPHVTSLPIPVVRTKRARKPRSKISLWRMLYHRASQRVRSRTQRKQEELQLQSCAERNVLKSGSGIQEYTNPAYVTTDTPEPERKPNGIPSTSTGSAQGRTNITSDITAGMSTDVKDGIASSSGAGKTVTKATMDTSGQNGPSVPTGVASSSSTGTGATPAVGVGTTSPGGRPVPPGQPRPPPGVRPPGARPLKSALVNPSPPGTDTSLLAQLKRAQARYTHPYGNSATILEELLYGEDDDFVPANKQEENSPVKLVIWITFCFFMVGVAGAIILGAESFRQTSYHHPLLQGGENMTSSPG